MKTRLDPAIAGVTLVAWLSLGLPGLAHAAVCDVDRDGDIDRADIKQIVIARDTRTGRSDDPRDADGDGNITMLDARACIRQCNLPNCKIIGSSSSAPADVTPRVQPPKPAPTPEVTRDAARPSGSSFSGSEWRVKRGDTLYAIGRAIFPGDARRQTQLRQDIVRLNPAVFADGANNMAVGVVLKLPDYVALEAAPATQPEIKTDEKLPAVAAPESTATTGQPKSTPKAEPAAKAASRPALPRVKGSYFASAGFSFGGDEVVEVDSGLDFLAGSGAHFNLGYETLENRRHGYRVALGLQYNLTLGGGSDDATLRDTYLLGAYQYRADDLVYGVGLVRQLGATVDNDAGDDIDYDAANGIVFYVEDVGNGQWAGWGLSYTSIELDEQGSDETADASRIQAYYSWRF